MASRPDESRAIVASDVAEVVGRLGAATNRLSGATILVTGASGMIGGYLADVAAALNSLNVLDSPCTLFLATRRAPNSTGRLGHLLGRPDVRFVVGQDLAPSDLPPRVDVVLHAASPASPQHYLADPVGTLDANSRYLRLLLERSRDSGARGFLFISSSEIYGDPPDSAIPTPEDFIGQVDPVSPRACYAEGKRFGEALCMAFHRQHDLPTTIIRPFHVHGPGMRLDDGRIVAELISKGLKGEQVRLLSDGTATRCYGYVSDAVAGAYAALLGEHQGHVFNIGADAPETTILELAEVVADLLGTPPPLPSATEPPPHLANAPRRSKPDLSKARRLLGYEPHVTLREGLRRTVAWHKGLMP